MNWLPGPHWGPVLAVVAWGLGLGAVGGLVTEIGPWYRNLRKPSWQPPDWLFAPVWSTIFGLAGWAAVIGWRHLPGRELRWWLVGLMLANAVLNAGWSVLFFKWRRPDWALGEVFALWGSILGLIVLLTRGPALGAWLLVPYLLWVSFATFLNYTIVRLNAPFGLSESR